MAQALSERVTLGSVANVEIAELGHVLQETWNGARRYNGRLLRVERGMVGVHNALYECQSLIGRELEE